MKTFSVLYLCFNVLEKVSIVSYLHMQNRGEKCTCSSCSHQVRRSHPKPDSEVIMYAAKEKEKIEEKKIIDLISRVSPNNIWSVQ